MEPISFKPFHFETENYHINGYYQSPGELILKPGVDGFLRQVQVGARTFDYPADLIRIFECMTVSRDPESKYRTVLDGYYLSGVEVIPKHQWVEVKCEPAEPVEHPTILQPDFPY